MIASQRAFAMRVVDAVATLIDDSELAAIGPSESFLATELKKHSLDVAKLDKWVESARDAINRSDAVVAGRVIEAGVSLVRSFISLGL